ncbi:MAG TPA: oligosaccharide flippase family protein [Chitinophagaceae bacterium]|nr:oligosaccharide flippase family protein [Chitinophagaceae bacterium]
MKLVKSFSVYAFTLFFNAALSFATFSLLTRFLSEVDYGIINLYSSFTIFLIPFISVGVPFTLSVDYFKMDDQAYRQHFTNALAIPVFSSIVLTLVFLLLLLPLQQLLKANYFFILVLPLSCLLTVLNEIILNLIRNKGRHYLFAAYSISRNLMEIGLTILLVVGMGMAWEGRLGSAFIVSVTAAIFILYLLKKWKLFSKEFSKEDTRSVFNIGLPFIPERLAIFVLAYSDRFFIDYYHGTGEVGYYGAGAQLALIVNLSILTLNNTFYPHLYQKLSATLIDYKGIRKVILVFIGLALVVTLVVITFTPFIFRHFVGETFQPGQKYAILLSVGFFFWAVYNVFLAFLLNSKKNKTIMMISIAGMISSVILNFINVKYFGPIGATYTSIAVYMLMAGMVIFAVHRYFGLGKIIRPLFKSAI